MHNHFRLLHFTLKRDLGSIYTTIFLRTFAISLISLFVPIYFLEKVGADFSDVLVYLTSLYFFTCVGYFFGAYLGAYIGIKKLIMLSIPFYILYYIFVYNLDILNVSYIFLGGILAVGEALFWVAYNTDFAKFSDRRHRIEEVKVWFVLASAIGILGPFIGGLLLTYLGFPLVFIIVISLFFLSIFPLFHLREKKTKYRLKLGNIFRKGNFENSPRYLVQGMRHLVSGVFWPLFVFYILREYASVGFIFSTAALFSSFVIWVIGNQLTTVNKEVLTDFSSMIHGVVSFVKVFLTNFAQIFFVALPSYITYGVSEIAVNALSFDQANKTRVIEFFVFREIIFSIARISLLVIILFSGLDLLAGLRLSFILLGFVSLIQKLF